MQPTNTNLPGGRDTKGHATVQPWSQGDIFPAVIARRETYNYTGDLIRTRWVLHYPGFAPMIVKTYDRARELAGYLRAPRILHSIPEWALAAALEAA